MKILTFTTLFPHNINPNFGIFIANRMTAFAKRGHEVKVVAPVPYFPGWSCLKRFPKWHSLSQVARKEERMGMEVFHPRYFLTPKIGMSFYGLEMFFSVLPLVRQIRKSFAFDLIDAHYLYPDGLAAILLGKLFDCPVVVSARGSDVHQYSEFFWIKKWLKYVLKSSCASISVSSDIGETMVELGSPAASTHIIPNGIDGKIFYCMDKQEARAKCNLPQDQKIILGVGHLNERKNFLLLVEAMNFLAKGEHLYLIGQGDAREKFISKIAECKLQDRVHLISPVKNSELCYWYNAADLLCHPSKHEGSPNVVCEAIACGCPVVASNLAGCQKAVQSEKQGTIVPTWELKDYIHALEEALWKKEYDRKWISTEGHKRTWDSVAVEVEDVFQKALQKYQRK
ncbi:MAG: glycosyltransferase [Candidatus Brocadiae bacterium]|nr:glycosyltransferase [Candidatus Brocadiia bacterium]